MLVVIFILLSTGITTKVKINNRSKCEILGGGVCVCTL